MTRIYGLVRLYDNPTLHEVTSWTMHGPMRHTAAEVPDPWGKELRARRVDAGLTMGDLADLAGLTVVDISDLERGRKITNDREALIALIERNRRCR